MSWLAFKVKYAIEFNPKRHSSAFQTPNLCRHRDPHLPVLPTDNLHTKSSWPDREKGADQIWLEAWSFFINWWHDLENHGVSACDGYTSIFSAMIVFTTSTGPGSMIASSRDGSVSQQRHPRAVDFANGLWMQRQPPTIRKEGSPRNRHIHPDKLRELASRRIAPSQK